MGPADLTGMIEPLLSLAGGSDRVLVGPETADDAGVYLHAGRGLVATADFITPVCDDPARFGRVAAANALSDVFAMGGRPLFALNLCCFPGSGVPSGVLGRVLEGAARLLGEAGTVLLGGHTVHDKELKFGLSVVGEVDPDRILKNSGAMVGDHLILTKPLGTGVLINAFKLDHLDEAGLEPALLQMERLNDVAAVLALKHGASAATDITGYGLAGHALEVARASSVGLRIIYSQLPVLPGFNRLVAAGVTTGATASNRSFTEDEIVDQAGLLPGQRELLHDPQTSGGLLICVPAAGAAALLIDLKRAGHEAADIGRVLVGSPRLEIA